MALSERSFSNSSDMTAARPRRGGAVSPTGPSSFSRSRRVDLGMPNLSLAALTETPLVRTALSAFVTDSHLYEARFVCMMYFRGILVRKRTAVGKGKKRGDDPKRVKIGVRSGESIGRPRPRLGRSSLLRFWIQTKSPGGFDSGLGKIYRLRRPQLRIRSDK